MTAPDGPVLLSAEQRLRQIAHAADRAERALRLWTDTLIATPIDQRPEVLPGDRVARAAR